MLDPARLVFIDETVGQHQHGADQGPRSAGRACDWPRAACEWKTITFVAALRHNKMTAPMVVDGPLTGEMFLAYVKQCLVQPLSVTTSS